MLLETEWVLHNRHDVEKTAIVAALIALPNASELQFEDEHSIEEAVFILFDQCSSSRARVPCNCDTRCEGAEALGVRRGLALQRHCGRCGFLGTSRNGPVSERVSRGMSNTRSAMMLRWISSVPPAIDVAGTDSRISAMRPSCGPS